LFIKDNNKNSTLITNIYAYDFIRIGGYKSIMVECKKIMMQTLNMISLGNIRFF